MLERTTTQPSNRRRGLLAPLALLLLALLALSACGAEAPAPSPTPTKTLVATFTPTSAAIAMATQTAGAAATEAARATPTPTVTPIPTDTPVPTETPVPPTDTPEPPTATPLPAPPTATPRPVVVVPPTAVPTQPPPPPPAGDAAECAALGGDGCKFRIRSGGGPVSANNGGGELKLQLFFIHSGVDGGQPQGDYRVWLEKDGQKLPGFDDARSIALSSQDGPLGRYNYEYSIGVDRVPGNTVAGNYVVWVLDGNRDRDSLNFSFNLPEGNGLVWIEFDQG